MMKQDNYQVDLESTRSNIIRSGSSSFFASLNRTLLGFPIEYPLHMLTTLSQANPAFNTKMIIKQAISESAGFKLYRGGFPYMLKIFLRSSYHTAGIIYFRDYYENILLRHEVKNFILLKNILSALTMTTLNTLIFNPFDRYRTFLITQSETNHRFFYKNASHWLRESSRGFLPNYARSVVSWGVFLLTEEYLRTWLLDQKEVCQRDSEKVLSARNLLALGFLGGGINLLVTLPLETVTTHMQKANSPCHTIKQATQFIYGQYGVKGFYTAWGIKLLHYTVTTAFSAYTIQLANSSYRRCDNIKHPKENHCHTAGFFHTHIPDTEDSQKSDGKVSKHAMSI